MKQSKFNFGFGRQLRYAMCQAVHQFYGYQDHFGTRRAHACRIRIFARFCLRQGVVDARDISQSTLDAYGSYLRMRLSGEYVWQDGQCERAISVAYAHNLVSTANTALYAMRGDQRLWISARKALGVARRHVRDHAAVADMALVDQAVDIMIGKGDQRGAAVILLARHWGMRAQEATLQNIERMKDEIAKTGFASILEGCKGGRRDASRRLAATPERLASLKFALSVRPEGAHCLLGDGENVKAFYQTELNRCRRVLKSVGILSFRELRAGLAADVYEGITGIRPFSGRVLDRDLDKQARLRVSCVLGHNREQVSSCYVGGY